MQFDLVSRLLFMKFSALLLYFDLILRMVIISMSQIVNQRFLHALIQSLNQTMVNIFQIKILLDDTHSSIQALSLSLMSTDLQHCV